MLIMVDARSAVDQQQELANFFSNWISFGVVERESNAKSSTIAEVLALKKEDKEIFWTLDIPNELNLLPEKVRFLCDSQPASN